MLNIGRIVSYWNENYIDYYASMINYSQKQEIYIRTPVYSYIVYLATSKRFINFIKNNVKVQHE